MKQKLAIAACLLAMSQPVAAAKYLLAEEGYEVRALHVALSGDNEGLIAAKRCDQCPSDTLQVSAKTRLFHAGREVPLERLEDFLGRQATVFREFDSMNVTRIVVYP